MPRPMITDVTKHRWWKSIQNTESKRSCWFWTRPMKNPSHSPQVGHRGASRSLRKVLFEEIRGERVVDGEVVVVGATCLSTCINPWHATTVDQYDNLSAIQQERSRSHEAMKDLERSTASEADLRTKLAKSDDFREERMFKRAVNMWLSAKEDYGKWPKWKDAGMGFFPVPWRDSIEADARARRKEQLGPYELE